MAYVVPWVCQPCLYVFLHFDHIHAKAICLCLNHTSLIMPMSCTCHVSMLLLLSHCAMSKPFSWCNNKSWPYTHDSLSLHRRHCALVSIISHCIWVNFIVASSSCLIQVYLGATIDHRAYDSSSCLIAQVILPLCHIWEGESVSHPILLWPHVAHHYISWSPCVGANNACPCALLMFKALHRNP